MRIDIDDLLMRRALRATGLPTRKAAVEAGLRLLVKRHGQKAIQALGGKVDWRGDLGAHRCGRSA